MTLDMTKLEPLLGMMVNELGAAANAALVLTGEKLGFYKALAGGEPVTPAELAEKTGTHERYVREWLSAQAASGFVTYDARSGRFTLSPEQAAVLADDDSPVYMGGGFTSLAAVFADEPKLTAAFRTGKGVGWGEHCNCLFCGTERFFRPGYKAHLLSEWLPALDGVVGKLERGARVADVGCGHGASTVIMAEAFPNSEFVGIDFHEPSVLCARDNAKNLGNVRFEVARAQDYAGSGYDLVTIFDALHDMGDPAGAAAHVRRTLRPDGTLMLVEPRAGDTLADNLNPIGRVYYAFSASICVPASLGQEVGTALGAQAGEKRLAEVVCRGGGFSRIRRAAETPFNMILEARP
ncbi:class I SAM-dependent methyltransferase [Inquilinus sp. Marseille-Q2685]|uniref:class I SAM-dependent methyltransferase n=1 Tax=Inquilinus sp. Marseille-Q2685 TaxID=2866581 RepID=UPI001CE48AE7|nr:class I SAM-dependent methyltransferase [Inquilinus sp. Marseille-Q2685]